MQSQPSRRPTVLTAFAFAGAILIASAASDARAQCVFSGVTALPFGTGTGVCSTSTLAASFDPGACALTIGIAPDVFFCGNTFLTNHLLILGVSSFPAGIPASAPNLLPNSFLYVNPLVVLGPIPGKSLTFALPNDATLIGFTFYAQSVPTFITTIHLPVVPELGLSSALALTPQ